MERAKHEFIMCPDTDMDLEQLIVKAKYAVKATSVEQVYDSLLERLNHGCRLIEWTGEKQGNTMKFIRELGPPKTVVKQKLSRHRKRRL